MADASLSRLNGRREIRVKQVLNFLATAGVRFFESI
jgi:hypothetical protein